MDTIHERSSGWSRQTLATEGDVGSSLPTVEEIRALLPRQHFDNDYAPADWTPLSCQCKRLDCPHCYAQRPRTPRDASEVPPRQSGEDSGVL